MNDTLERFEQGEKLQNHKQRIGVLIMQKVAQSGIYNDQDLQMWQEAIHACGTYQELIGLYEYSDRAIQAAKRLIGSYRQRVHAVVREGVWAETEGQFAESSFESASMEFKQRMSLYLDGHIEMSISLLNEFEDNLAVMYLTDMEVKMYKRRFKHAKYEEREELIGLIVTQVENREILIASWELELSAQEHRLVEGNAESVLLWCRANQKKIEHMKRIPAFGVILDSIQQLKLFAQQCISAAEMPENEETVPSESYDVITSKEGENEREVETQSRSSVIRNILAEAFSGFEKGAGEHYADGSFAAAEELEEDEEDDGSVDLLSVSEFKTRISLAFTRDPDIAPTGLRVETLDKRTAVKIAEILQYVAETHAIPAQVRTRLENKHVDYSIFSVDEEALAA
jgi:hypothetical protein